MPRVRQACAKRAPKAYSHHETWEWRNTGRLVDKPLYFGSAVTRQEQVYEWAETPYRGNLKIVKRQPMRGRGSDCKGESLTLWDGETHSFRATYMPFCSLRCALAFAKASYRAGYRLKSTTTPKGA